MFDIKDLHYCSIDVLVPDFEDRISYCSDYGSAIDDCKESDDGTLVAGNSEYGTRVNFCPFCGYKAKSQYRIEKNRTRTLE